MPVSNVNIDAINTIPILSVAAAFTYTFEIPENARVQILWSQFLSVADATVGTRRIVLQIRNDTATLVMQIAYFATQAASGSTFITFAQGLTIIPANVLGLVTTIPADGIFVRNDWTLNFVYFPFVSVGDTFTGFFQTRGLHNSAAQN